MDKQTKTEIKAVVREAIQEAMEVYKEKWITDEEMVQYFSVMTKRWLQSNGHYLPRTQIVYTDKKSHATSWLYPLHKIQAMMADGRIKELKVGNTA